jgi:uncharacterized protein with GYD domain
MAKYLVMANYVGDGVQGLMKDGGTGRVKAVKKLLASVGGKVEAMYYAFGEWDVYLIVDVPDNTSAMALSMITNGSGAVQLRTVVLMTPEEVDEAAKMSPTYRKPGG